jgi:broad specificity phosphatase PhoE
MRHGETYEPRPDARLPGADEDPHLPLTPRGRERLAEVSRWLAETPIAASFSSPYLRSRETARIVGAPHGLEPTPLDGLRELAIHPEPGGTLGDVARRYVELIRDLAQKSEYDVRLDCGRSLGAVVDGALDAVRQALDGSAGTLLVVAHGGLNRFLLGRWLGMPAVRAIAIEQNFACVNVVEFVGSGHPWVRAVNCTLHDPLKLGDPGF